VGVPVYRHLDPAQPSLLSPKRTQRLYDSPEISRSTGFPQAAVNVFANAASTPDIQRYCSLFPFLVGSARSLARRPLSCISRVLSASLPLTATIENQNAVVTARQYSDGPLVRLAPVGGIMPVEEFARGATE
jgi:hypothetical protein